jgi:hypothetical protein
VGVVGCRAARLAVTGARRQDARRCLLGRFAPGVEDVRAGWRRPVAPPPHRHQLHQRGRGRQARAHHRRAAKSVPSE